MQYDPAVNQPTGNRCPALPKALALGLARGIDTPGQVFMRRSSRSTFGRSIERLFSSLFSSERPNPDFNELRTGHQERPGVARTPNARCCVQTTTLDRKGDPRPKLQARPAQGSRICHAEPLCATIVFKGSPPGMNTAERYGISSSSSHPAIATGVWFGTTPCLQPSTWLETARRKHETSTSGRLPSEHAIAPDRVGFMPIRCFGHSCPDLLILSGIFMNDRPRVAIASCLPLPPHDPAASSASEPITGSPSVPTFEIDRRHRSPPSSSDNTVHRSVGLASKPAAEECGSEPHPSAIGSRSDNGRPWRLQADSGCHAFKALR
jgi:hypothetical protein